MPEKMKFEMEFMLRSSNKILFNSLSTADGLAEWFADEVSAKDDIFIFRWDGNEQRAKVISKKNNEHIKFQWEDEENTFFEFLIKTDPLTQEVALLITDFADEDEVEESKFLWNNQVNTLKQRLGA
jgi:uncharacterized protein YndB with AHSA1/START domain